MAEILNYTMNLGFDMTSHRQVSLCRNKLLTRRIVGRDNNLLRPEVHG